MKTIEEILNIINKLDNHIADDFEAQDLDFKEWNDRSRNDAMKLVVKMAVCMANGGGGTVVFGIRDKIKGKENAILGMPLDIDVFELVKMVYEKTDPHITPNFQWIDVNYGTGKILMMNILAGQPPYTLTDGSATIRIGKDCRPLTGSMRKEVFATTGASDFTSDVVHEDWKNLFSPIAMERIRKYMEEERAPDTLCSMNDEDLLVSIGALKDGKLTIGGILIVGNDKAIAKYVPNYRWDYRKMLSSTDYSIKDGGISAIPIGVYEIERYANTDNPITTLKVGFVHPEFPTYPQIALREALLNAFIHRDYRIPGPIMLKQYKNRIELTNPGNFIGGITPENILHHQPNARNNHLADLLDKLKLVNRSNLGVPRIYKSLLMEGKEPPQYRELGETIELVINASDMIPQFRKFIRTMIEKGIDLDVDHLIILNYLMKHREIDNTTASKIIQRNYEHTKEVLSYLENNLKIIHSGGNIRNKSYMFTRIVYDALEASADYDRDKKLDKESVKLRILSILKERNLTNMEIRQITDLDRQNVLRVMKELEYEGVRLNKKGRWSHYYLEHKNKD